MLDREALRKLPYSQLREGADSAHTQTIIRRATILSLLSRGEIPDDDKARNLAVKLITANQEGREYLEALLHRGAQDTTELSQRVNEGAAALRETKRGNYDPAKQLLATMGKRIAEGSVGDASQGMVGAALVKFSDILPAEGPPLNRLPRLVTPGRKRLRRK